MARQWRIFFKGEIENKCYSREKSVCVYRRGLVWVTRFDFERNDYLSWFFGEFKSKKKRRRMARLIS